MAKSKDDITYGTAQAKLAPDEALRIRYKHGTPLEGGYIAQSEIVDVFASAGNIQYSQQQQEKKQREDQQHAKEASGGAVDTDVVEGAPVG